VALLDATRSEMATPVERLRRAQPGLRILGLAGPGTSDPDGGFEACLEAPLDADELRLRLQEARKEGSTATAAEPPAPVFDRARLAARLGNDDEAAQRVLLRFAEQAGPRLRDLAEAVDSGDGRAIQQQTHRLRGGLSWIGAEHAAKVAADIEELCRAGETQRAAALCETLRQETERVVTAVRGSSGYNSPGRSGP
jgi:HPt (histidine-containing phosphotransfer) domain-containing protein